MNKFEAILAKLTASPTRQITSTVSNNTASNITIVREFFLEAYFVNLLNIYLARRRRIIY
jgi:hypothetical protein